jgi:hypothetical protein
MSAYQIPKSVFDFPEFTEAPQDGEFLQWDEAEEKFAYATAGGGAWGTITGTLSNQTDLQTALNAKQNSLGFTPEDVARKATDFSTVNNTLYPTVQAVKAYADALVVGLIDDRGNFDASGNLFGHGRRDPQGRPLADLGCRHSGRRCRGRRRPGARPGRHARTDRLELGDQ